MPCGHHLYLTDLSSIQYHFTPCGSTGFRGPTFVQCEAYYQENLSPIATDGLLFQFDENTFRGGQGFRIPREDVYNVTIAGAAGGRGLCNIHVGRGRRLQFQMRLTPVYELLVMVGQKGKGPCDDPFGHPLCHNSPTDVEMAAECNQTWYESGSGTDSRRLEYRFNGGGAGGGATMLRARNIENGSFPIAVAIAGGGGGTPAILDYDTTIQLIRNLTSEPVITQPDQSYQYHIDARILPSSDIDGWFDGFRGFRPSSDLSIIAGAGGGWSSFVSSSTSDGKSISQPFNFAKGGLDCGTGLQLFRQVNGGFGGGGGECGGGGGGGGFTGGAVLEYRNDMPGGGGHSVYFLYSTSLTIETESVEYSFNSGDGYVDIVPASCNCSGTCAVNEVEDTFECFCPENTTVALDGFDCYYGESFS